ncbi:MAG: YibE/F family protein [Lachnospiraceae bacterium]|nr:YibE/F family protein [Lachnospiraceae bacterium]MBQ1172087.1 YibE/F family protein [Lachnospiraceae bacterium]
MKTLEKLKNNKTLGPVFLWICLLVILLCMPTGFESALTYRNAERVDALVIATDESDIVDTGLVRSGEQRCLIRILSGSYKDTETYAVNRLNGSLAEDKLFSPGDHAFVVVSHAGGEITTVYMTDHFRLDKEVILAASFLLLLLLFARGTGVRAILSFVDTVLLLWKVLVPALLKGYNPIWISLFLVLVLTFLVLSLIYGWDKRCVAATTGAALGILVTAVLGYLFTDLFQIHGAVMESSESLLYAGYQHLNLTRIFVASIFLGSSGAVMDLSVDICSAVYEVIEKRPDISAKEAISSGFAIGRAACGSTTTTLLLAYSGSYIALLMVFMAQGTPVELMLNYKYVAAEIVHTIVGSFGLVTVAPLTAITSGLLLTKNRK